jgi:hypothetical protein
MVFDPAESKHRLLAVSANGPRSPCHRDCGESHDVSSKQSQDR